VELVDVESAVVGLALLELERRFVPEEGVAEMLAHLVLARGLQVLARDPALLDQAADESSLAGVAGRHGGRLVGADLLERQEAVQEGRALAVAEAHELEGALLEPEVERLAVLFVTDGERAGLLVGDQVLK